MELKDLEYYDIEVEGEENTQETEENDDFYKIRRQKNKNNGPVFLIVGLILFVLSATMLAIVFLFFGEDLLLRRGDVIVSENDLNAEPEVTYTQSEVEKMIAEAEDKVRKETAAQTAEEIQDRFFEASKEESGMLKLLRDTYPDQVVYISGTKYEYFPVYQELAKNTLDNGNIVKNELDGTLSYFVDGVAVSHAMIDVSSFQKDIDWNKVAASGIEYAMIRCAFRGYESGKIVDDPYFEQNIKAALKAGIKVGVYFFTQAKSPEEAVEEAEYVLDLVAPYELTLPIAIDVEDVAAASRTDDMTADEISEASKAFMDRIKEAGHDTMIYSNAKYFIKNLNVQTLEGYDKWFALYNDTLYYPYEITAWQYSATGSVDGITGEVDLNITFKDW